MKKVLKFLLLPLLIAVTFYLLLRGQSLSDIMATIGGLNRTYLAMAILLMFIYMFLEAAMLHVLLNIDSKERFSISLKSMFIGQFYSLITPFASGGQPVQLYYFIKDGVRGSLATAVLINKFLYFQIGVTLYSLFLFIIKRRELSPFLVNSKVLIAFGIVFNLVGLTLLLLSIFQSDRIKHLAEGITNFMIKIGFSAEKSRHRLAHINHEVDDFASSARMLLTHKKVLFELSLMTIVQLTSFFGITYFIYRAFGHSGNSMLSIIALQAVLYMSISLIPAPGSAGVAEGGFFIVFGSIFPSAEITSAILMWRGITYYLNLSISALVTIVISIKNHIKLRSEL